MEAGRPRYDLVILDAPATGHGLEMLRVPRVLLDIAPPGLLRREAERAWDLFQDPYRSGMLIVTLAEDMPVNESVELYGALTKELGLPVAAVAVNSVIPRLFAQPEGDWVSEVARKSTPADLIHTLLHAGRRRVLRERVQAESIERLSKELPLRQIVLPHLVVSELRRKEIEELSRAFG
jgi:anion-transporting  ArsA/GET3 family ATPase